MVHDWCGIYSHEVLTSCSGMTMDDREGIRRNNRTRDEEGNKSKEIATYIYIYKAKENA